MEKIITKKTEANIKIEIANKSDYKCFFDSFFFKINQRKEIFEIIYNFLFKTKETFKIEDSPEDIEDYIKTKDNMYSDKKNREIIQLFNINEKEFK